MEIIICAIANRTSALMEIFAVVLNIARRASFMCHYTRRLPAENFSVMYIKLRSLNFKVLRAGKDIRIFNVRGQSCMQKLWRI